MRNLILFFCILTTLTISAKPISNLTKKTIKVDGRLRSYLVSVPEHTKESTLPILIVMHGGGGSAKAMSNNNPFHLIGDAENWIVVYPQATRHRFKSNWNDGRVHSQKGKESFDQINDVKYILEIIKRLKINYSISPKKIYATGISNGAYMAQKLASEHANIFAAFATVIGSMSEPVSNNFSPNGKVSVLMMNGTDDPIVPINGGNVKFRQHSLGYSLSIDKVINFWIENNQLYPTPLSSFLPDNDKNDNCKIEKLLYHNKKTGITVEQLIMHGGGHTSAGSKTHALARFVGNTCRDIQANDYIVEFLDKHSK